MVVCHLVLCKKLLINNEDCMYLTVTQLQCLRDLPMHLIRGQAFLTYPQFMTDHFCSTCDFSMGKLCICVPLGLSKIFTELSYSVMLICSASQLSFLPYSLQRCQTRIIYEHFPCLLLLSLFLFFFPHRHFSLINLPHFSVS